MRRYRGPPIFNNTEIFVSTKDTRDQGVNIKKVYDFFISEFEKDTLKGFLHHFNQKKEIRTNNTKIITDEVKPVTFIRGSDLYDIDLSRKVITTLGIDYASRFCRIKQGK